MVQPTTHKIYLNAEEMRTQGEIKCSGNCRVVVLRGENDVVPIAVEPPEGYSHSPNSVWTPLEGAANMVFLAHCGQNFPKLRDAALALYMAGKWTCDSVSDNMQAALWQDLRDALCLKPGTATKLGVGA